MKTSLNKYLGYSLVFLLIGTSCKKKDQEITFEFEIMTEDYYSEAPIANVDVKAYSKGVNSGTYTNTFQLQGSEFSNNNGISKVSVPYGGIEVIKFTFEKDGYFSQSKEYNPDDFSTDGINSLFIPLKQKGFVFIRIRNVMPISAFDEITFNSINADCQECVKFNSMVFSGTSVDTTLLGTIVNNRHYKYQYIVTKNGVSTNYLDSTFCNGDTTFININY